MSPLPFRRCRALLFLLLSLACASCIAWRGGLERLDPKELPSSAQPRALTFDVTYLSNGKSKDPEEAAAEIRKALMETGLFASVERSFDKGPLHISFEFEESFNATAVGVSGFISGLTLFLFPAWGKADYSLEAVLHDGYGTRQSARYEDEYHVLLQIVLLPATPFLYPPKVEKELVQNLALHAVAELMSPATPPSR